MRILLMQTKKELLAVFEATTFIKRYGKLELAKYFHVRGNQQMELTCMLFQYLKMALLLAICQKEFLEYVLHLFVGVER